MGHPELGEGVRKDFPEERVLSEVQLVRVRQGGLESLGNERVELVGGGVETE